MLKNKNYYKLNQSSVKHKSRNTIKVLTILIILPVFIVIGVSFSNNIGNESSAEKANISVNSIDLEHERSLLKAVTASPLKQINIPQTGQIAVGTKTLGSVVSSENEIQVPIASITKVITSLAILEKQPIEIGQQGTTITLTAQDEQYYWDYVAKLGTVTPVTAGLTMTQYEALQAILLPSSNNMADTLVDQYFESSESYLKYANDLLKSLGIENTVVADASGFSPDSKSTPSDLIKIGQLALDNPIIAEIVAQPEATISVAGVIPNYNPLINDPDVIGLKPGLTDEAGYTLLFAANLPKSNGESEIVIAVVLGYQDRAEHLQVARDIISEARIALLSE